MSEIPSGIRDAEGSNHWCPTYQGLQQQLSALERAEEQTRREAPVIMLDVWEGHGSYIPTYVTPPNIVAAKQVLMQHRTSCEPCVAHFSPNGA